MTVSLAQRDDPNDPGAAPARAQGLAAFLMQAGGLGRDRALPLALGASLSRFAVIHAVNRIAMGQGAAGEGGGAGAGTLSGMAPELIALAVSALMFLLLSYLAQYRAHVIVSRVQTHVRLRLARLVLRAEPRFLKRREAGGVYDAMTSEVADLSEAVIWGLRAVESALVALIAIPYIFWISWSAGLATLLAIGLGAAGFFLLDPPARRLARLAREANAAFCDRVEDMLKGWQELRLHAPRRAALEAEALALVEEVRQQRLASERLFSGATVVSQSAMVLLLCFVVVLVPVLQGGGAGLMLQVLTVVLLTFGPIEALFTALPRLSVGQAALDRIGAVEHALGVVQELGADVGASCQTGQAAQRAVSPGFDTIALRGAALRLAEPGGEGFDLGPVDLSFAPGETVFITGGNGSGKSTLISALAGLLPLDSGQIELDGSPVTPGQMPRLRALFSAVPSDFHLFGNTYGLDAAALPGLSERIADMGLSQRVSLKGGRFASLALSAGQRRRLALAVALAEARPILVLDEFAADQDPANRAYFYDSLLPALSSSGRLVIAVTHDAHQFHKCDRLIRMEAGRVVSVERPGKAQEGGKQEG